MADATANVTKKYGPADVQAALDLAKRERDKHKRDDEARDACAAELATALADLAEEAGFKVDREYRVSLDGRTVAVIGRGTGVIFSEWLMVNGHHSYGESETVQLDGFAPDRDRYQKADEATDVVTHLMKALVRTVLGGK